MASRVNLGMGGPQKKSPAKKSTVKRKTNGQGVKMKSKGGAMGGKKDLPPYIIPGGRSFLPPIAPPLDFIFTP